MEVKKLVRKATAIAASASFVGATLLGAVAQDLATYPAPFVKDGTFDAFIVVGADAQPMDVVGAVDVGASLQFALKKAATTATAPTEATITEGYKVQKSGNKLNYGENVSSILEGTSITEDDMPAVLADGKFVESNGDNKNSVTYTQELRINDVDTAKLVFDQDDDLAPKASDYFFIAKNQELYNYSLEFDDSVDYNSASDSDALDDLKTSTITIQGKVYTITDVSLNNGAIDKLTLLSGEAVLWLTQNQPITKTVNGIEHKIEVLDVTEQEDACQVKVDDVTSIIDEDETKVVNGVQIGITDVRAIHAQLQDVDVCQISVGATELVITNGDEVKVDDVDLEGSKGYIYSSNSSNTGSLNEIVVLYTPKDQDDHVYLAKGEAFTDPIFGSWKIAYGGVVADYETYSVKTAGDDSATFKFINNDGKEIAIPLYHNGSATAVGKTIFLGDGNDVDERIYSAGVKTNITANTCVGTSSVEDCEGMRILATTSNNEAHLFEIASIDTDSNTTDIKDLTYGRTYNDVSYVPEMNSSIDLKSFGTGIKLNISENQKFVLVVDAIANAIETKAGALIDIDDSTTLANVTITVNERNTDGENDIADEADPKILTITVNPNADQEIALDASFNSGYATKDLEEDSDYDVAVSYVGTKVTIDDEGGDSVVVEVPKAEVYGNVFLAPIVAEMSTTGSGIASYTLSKLNVGAAKLDSEVSDVTSSNLIIVGGPCANKAAAQVLGLTYPACGASSGIAENTAVIKEVAQSGGKVALLVAGWEAMDTRRATRVLANYDAYDLSGSSVTVTGTSLTDIKVSKSV